MPLYHGAGAVIEGRAHHQRHAVHLAQLHRARMQHLGAEVGQLQDLLMADRVQFAGVGDNARIGRQDAVHVLVELAPCRLQGHRHGDGGGVGAAAANRRDVAGLIHALETGDDADAPLFQGASHALRLDRGHQCPAMLVVGADTCLAGGKRDRRQPEAVQRHRQEGGRHRLARRHQHVQLAGIGIGVHLAGESDQFIGGVAHRRDHDRHLVAVPIGPGDPRRHHPDAVGIGHRTSTELLHNPRHVGSIPERK
jgi:hypothetical protein